MLGVSSRMTTWVAPLPPPTAPATKRHQEGGQQHEQDAQGQEDELLDNEPPAIALLRLEQELHGRPAQPLEAHAVDQVDNDRGADEGAGGGEKTWVEKEF